MLPTGQIQLHSRPQSSPCATILTLRQLKALSDKADRPNTQESPGMTSITNLPAALVASNLVR